MMAKESLFFEVFLILKEAKKPISQQDIVDRLMAKGFKRTTVLNLFNPSILQPLAIKGKDPDIPTYPIIKTKRYLVEARPFYELNENWKDVDINEAKKLLTRIAYLA